MAKRRVQKKKSSSVRRRPLPLTPKRLQILRWCAKGYTKPQISVRVGMTLHGVDWHVRQISYKLRAKNTTHAVYTAYRLGLIG